MTEWSGKRKVFSDVEIYLMTVTLTPFCHSESTH